MSAGAMHMLSFMLIAFGEIYSNAYLKQFVTVEAVIIVYLINRKLHGKFYLKNISFLKCVTQLHTKIKTFVYL